MRYAMLSPKSLFREVFDAKNSEISGEIKRNSKDSGVFWGLIAKKSQCFWIFQNYLQKIAYFGDFFSKPIAIEWNLWYNICC